MINSQKKNQEFDSYIGNLQKKKIKKNINQVGIIQRHFYIPGLRLTSEDGQDRLGNVRMYMKS